MAIAVDLKTMHQRFHEAVQARDPQRAAELYAADAELAWPGGPAHHGRADIQKHWENLCESFPDMVVKDIGTVTADSTIVCEWKGTGTNTGTLYFPDGRSMSPTGKSVAFEGATITVMANGQITRQRFYFDFADVLGQLGLLPKI